MERITNRQTSYIIVSQCNQIHIFTLFSRISIWIPKEKHKENICTQMSIWWRSVQMFSLRFSCGIHIEMRENDVKIWNWLHCESMIYEVWRSVILSIQNLCDVGWLFAIVNQSLNVCALSLCVCAWFSDMVRVAQLKHGAKLKTRQRKLETWKPVSYTHLTLPTILRV